MPTNKPEVVLPKPKFGEWLRGVHASERNPHRDGMYVRTIIREGRFNPGKYYELTDGEGGFWTYLAESTERIAPPADTLTRPADGEWRGVSNEPECKLESDWGWFARVMVKCADGTAKRALFDQLTKQFQVPYDGAEIGGVVEWRYADPTEECATPQQRGQEVVSIPEGWRLVPIEPSWDMRNEGREFLIDGLEKEPEKLAYFLWKTMVAAAPEVK